MRLANEFGDINIDLKLVRRFGNAVVLPTMPDCIVHNLGAALTCL
jgi:hypothetical protein